MDTLIHFINRALKPLGLVLHRRYRPGAIVIQDCTFAGNSRGGIRFTQPE